MSRVYLDTPYSREDLKEAERDDLCRREGFDVAERRE